MKKTAWRFVGRDDWVLTAGGSFSDLNEPEEAGEKESEASSCLSLFVRVTLEA